MRQSACGHATVKRITNKGNITRVPQPGFFLPVVEVGPKLRISNKLRVDLFRPTSFTWMETGLKIIQLFYPQALALKNTLIPNYCSLRCDMWTKSVCRKSAFTRKNTCNERVKAFNKLYAFTFEHSTETKAYLK